MALKPFTLNIPITIGDDVPVSWIYKRNGVYIDISTWSFWLTIKTNKTDLEVAALVQLNPADFTVDDPSVGTNCRVSALIPRSVTTLMTEGDRFVDLQVMETTLIQTHGKGTAVVGWESTKRVT